jgi:hypothetical protein
MSQENQGYMPEVLDFSNMVLEISGKPPIQNSEEPFYLTGRCVES